MEFLGLNDVDVWYRQSDGVDGPALSAATTSLSKDERARAARFMRPDDRRDYVVAHDLQRRTLSRYAPLAATEWRFRRSDRGRPFIDPQLPGPLFFSLSHTHGFVACAVSRDEAIGLDVERIREPLTTDDVGDLVLTAEELAEIEACPASGRTTRLIELWTLKEAYLKATGRGLSDVIKQLSFAFAGDGTLVCTVPAEDAGPRWHAALFAPTAEARLSVIVGRDGDRPSIRVWDDDGPASRATLTPLRVSR